MVKFSQLKLVTCAISLTAALGPFSTVSHAQIFKGETAGAGGPVHAMFVAFTNQALADGKVAMMVRPAEVGSSNIERFGLNGEFRVLSILEAVVSGDAMQQLFGKPGRGMLKFEGDMYKGQLTEGTITALGFTQFVGTNSSVDEEVVYKATKSFWENLDDLESSRSIAPASGLSIQNCIEHWDSPCL